MMSSSILKTLVTRAYQVFQPRLTQPPSSISSLDLTSLTDLLHSLTDHFNAATDDDPLHLDSMYPASFEFRTSLSKKITFIEIENNPILNVVIVIVPMGQSLPLHDHPGMMGLIKVLHGSIRVSSYTKLDKDNSQDDPQRQPVLKGEELVLSKNNYPQTLTPSLNNIHGIRYENGEYGREYAAFLDVLSPSYDNTVGCHYYKENEEKEQPGQSSSLIEIDCPQDYRTVSVPYPFEN